MKAFLIVDVQNDFLPGGALAVADGDAIIPIINRLQSSFESVLATKDWHPKNHISFASTHGRKPGEVIEVGGIMQELWPDHCIQGSYGAEFAPKLNTKKIEKIFFKGTDPNIDSYSSFYDNAHMRSTGLYEYLQNRGITDLYIAGLATDYCVKFSVLDASKLGLNIYVIIDACRGIDLNRGDIQRAFLEMQTAGAVLLHSEKIMVN